MAKAEGLTLAELEAQIGGLLPNRIEMKRKRGRKRHRGGTTVVTTGPSTPTTNNTCTAPAGCLLQDPDILNNPNVNLDLL